MKEPTCGVSECAVTSSSAFANPTHITFTHGFDECASAKRISPPTVGTPMQLP